MRGVADVEEDRPGVPVGDDRQRAGGVVQAVPEEGLAWLWLQAAIDCRAPGAYLHRLAWVGYIYEAEVAGLFELF